MQLWDTAGQERFRSMAPMYYRGAASAIVCFDITNEDSFSKMKDWVEELKQNLAPGIHSIISYSLYLITHSLTHSSTDSFVLVIACNKVDLEDQRVVSKTRIVDFAKKCNALTFETSAKDNIGIDDLFKRISEEMVARKRATEGITTTNRDGNSLQIRSLTYFLTRTFPLSGSIKINENNNSGKLAKTKSNSSCC